MTKSIKFKVGSKFIERGKVYRIFKIERHKYNGRTERIIHYCPYFKNSINKTLVCSIPESSLVASNIRTPIPKNEVGDVFSNLSKKIRHQKDLNADQAKITLDLNDIYKTADILKRYWRRKNI